jgi:hypothetical protein
MLEKFYDIALTKNCSTIYANAPKTTKHRHTGLIGGLAKTTPIHVMAAITAIPRHRRDSMAKKEVSKSIFNTNPLGKQLKKVIWQQDEDGITPASFLERAARQEVRRIEKIDEEELGLGNLEIITAVSLS